MDSVASWHPPLACRTTSGRPARLHRHRLLHLEGLMAATGGTLAGPDSGPCPAAPSPRNCPSRWPRSRPSTTV